MGLNEVDERAIATYINWAESLQCGECHGATWPEHGSCGDDHVPGLLLLDRLGSQAAYAGWDDVVAALNGEGV